MAQNPCPKFNKIMQLSRSQRSARHQRRRKIARRGALAAAALLASANPLSVATASAADPASWTFEEALAIRNTYEPLVNAKCSYDFICELSEYQELAKTVNAEALAGYILNSHALIVTSAMPKTGAIKVFYNDRNSLTPSRTQTESGLYTLLTSAEITLKFTNTDQTYVFTDVSQLLPQQEIEIIPEGLDLPENASLSQISYKLRNENGGSHSFRVSIETCTKEKTYVPEQGCRAIVHSSRGVIMQPVVVEKEPDPVGPANPDPTDPGTTSPDPSGPDTGNHETGQPDPVDPPVPSEPGNFGFTTLLPTELIQIAPVPQLSTPTLPHLPTVSPDAVDDPTNSAPTETDALAGLTPDASSDPLRQSETAAQNPALPLAPNTGRPLTAAALPKFRHLGLFALGLIILNTLFWCGYLLWQRLKLSFLPRRMYKIHKIPKKSRKTLDKTVIVR